MSRWFFSHARHTAGDPTRPSSVEFAVTGAPSPARMTGPTLTLAGPADVAGIDPALILREQPPAGTADAPENVMASVDFAHGDLPWLLSTRSVATGSGPQPCPWIVLLVLADSESGPPRPADPTPVLDVPAPLLPALDDSWAWAHVEGRFDDGVTTARAAHDLALGALRDPAARVVSRLICPRQLRADTGYLAAVVPAPAAGRWPGPAAGGTVTVPVLHWWRFRTGAAGTFERLARRLAKNVTAADSGLGSRTIDVSRPWPTRPASAPVTTTVDGALRLDTTDTPETWSNTALQDAFGVELSKELADTTTVRAAAPPAAGTVTDPEALPTVGPPVYGATLTGTDGGPPPTNVWMTTLNGEVRRRVAAALGARYVQVEQEFLMARAWEQVGQIRAANRLLATAQLAAATADRAQRKHIAPLAPADLVTVLAPAADRVTLSPAFAGPTPGSAPTLAGFIGTGVTDGLASTAFSRLSRPGGALARRFERLSNTAVAAAPILGVDQLAEHTGAMPALASGQQQLTFPEAVRQRLTPAPLQFARMSALVPAVGARIPSDSTPDTTDLHLLRPIMAHPRFEVPIAGEILARWPDWAMPGITDLPEDSVTLLETNPPFVAALLVGLNEAFNRELLWREFPTDLRGTAFARFWPSNAADTDEIADWSPFAPLGENLADGATGTAVVVIRGALMRRFPHTPLLAVPGVGGRIPDDMTGALTATALRLDDATVLYLFSGLDENRAISEGWLFVLREPVHGTQFGYDEDPANPAGPPPVATAPPPASIATWADLTWGMVARTAAGYVDVGATGVTAAQAGTGDPPRWAAHAADMARIAFQQPFQLAVPASDWLGTP